MDFITAVFVSEWIFGFKKNLGPSSNFWLGSNYSSKVPPFSAHLRQGWFSSFDNHTFT